MLYLGLDLSPGSAGYALLDDLGSPAGFAVDCGSWSCKGQDFDDNCRALAGQLVALVRKVRSGGREIGMAGVEDIIRAMPMGKKRLVGVDGAIEEIDVLKSSPHTMLVQPAMAGTACGILHMFGIRSLLVPPSTWRKSFIGVGYAPRHIAKTARRQWLKTQAMRKAVLLGLRYGFEVRTNDESDALGLAFHLAAREGGSGHAYAAIARAA